MHIKQEYETGAEPSNSKGDAESRDSLIANWLPICDVGKQAAGDRAVQQACKAEDFVLQHDDNRLSALSISFMWFLIHMFYGLFLDRLFAIRDLCLV